MTVWDVHVARTSLPDPRALRAVTVPLAAAASFDAVRLAADEGRLVVGPARAVAGLGVAAVLPLPTGLEDTDGLEAVVAWLAALPHRVADGGAADGGAADGAAGGGAAAPGPIALGAFPFDRSAPAVLVVPRSTYWRQPDGRAWVVRVGELGDAPPVTDPSTLMCSSVSRPSAEGPGDPPIPDGTRQAAPSDRWAMDDAAFLRALDASPDQVPSGDTRTPLFGPPRLPRLRSTPEGRGYADAVRAVLTDIGAGRLQKVVLGRMVELRAGGFPSPAEILHRLWGADPAFHPFSMPIDGARLVGASPELVVARLGDQVTSHAFAGTIRVDEAGAARAADRLLASSKDRAEHRAVVEEISATLARRCDVLDVPSEPSVVALRSDARLGTLIRGTLRREDQRHGDTAAGGLPSALALLSDLHPTPAVGGVPRRPALERIGALEPAPRGYWAGPVGWLDARGDGEWVLAIRSVSLVAGAARVHAGAGIVAGSDPDAELGETTVKLAPVLEALCPGASRLL